MAALAIGISVGLSWIMGWYRPMGFAWTVQPLVILLPALVRNLLIQIQAGLIEEVQYRGYFMQVLGKRWGMAIAVFVSSLVFGLAHLGGPAEIGYPTWMALLSTGLAGLVYALAYLATRSLWLSIGLHFMHDWLIHLTGEIGRTSEEALFIISEVSGPPLLQGPQSAGLGVFDLVGLAVVAAILFVMYQKRGESADSPR